MFNNTANINGNGNTIIQKIVVYFGFSNVKGFIKQINGRKDSIDLIGEDYHITMNFDEGGNIESILKDNKCIIIGNPGSGKTQILVEIFLRIKEQLKKIFGRHYNNEFLPLFLPLKDLGEHDTLEKYIQNKIEGFNIKRDQKLILLLDGLDEINLKKTANILDFIENNQYHKYIISSRKSSINLGNFLSKHPDFNQYTIQEFNFDTNNGGNTEILEYYFQKRGKSIDLEKYRRLQIEIKDIFYLEQFFEVYEKLEEKDGKLELTEKFLFKISNKNNELIKFEIDINELFGLLTNTSEFLYISNALILEKEKVLELIKSISIQEDKRKVFLDYILNTFFIESEGKYSFRHKTFYEYFLVRYIFDEYSKNKLSIREGNILIDKNFIQKWFFAYGKREYIKNKNYIGIVGLNFFMSYYLQNNPIDEIQSEDLIKGLFNLPEDILRDYIYEKTSPIYCFFHNFYYLNYNTIKIILNKGYIDIANDFYDKLNNLITERIEKRKSIEEKIGKLNKNDEKYNFNKNELEQQLNYLFNGLNFKDQYYIKIHYKKFKSYYDLYKTIKSNYTINILEGHHFTSEFFENPYYAFLDNLLQYGSQKEVLRVINEFGKDEFYGFLQVGLKLENIKNFLGNQKILNKTKEKFIFYKGDFKEFINYNKNDLKIKDSAITLFLKYIFGFYQNEKEIYESEDFKNLKEGHSGFFNIHGGYSDSNLNQSQLASYIFYNQVDLKKTVEEEYLLSETQTDKLVYRYRGYYSNRIIYQYTYSIFINSILKDEKINFIQYMEIIKHYSSLRGDDSINIGTIYGEILAYIFYYHVNSNYGENINLFWEKLDNIIDKISFYKTIQKLDEVEGIQKLKEIINELQVQNFINSIEVNTEYPSSIVTNLIFISQLCWLNGNKKLQLKTFNKGIAHSYIKYGFRKDYYLTIVFEILVELKNTSIITEIETFTYLNKIIYLYGKIDQVTERGVQYLGRDIMNFLISFNLAKAIEYKEKIDDINYGFNEEIETNILIEKIKNDTFVDTDLDKLNYFTIKNNVLKLKIYLYLVEYGRDEFINEISKLIEEMDSERDVNYYLHQNDLNIYEKLYKSGKINKSEIILKELANKQINEKENITLSGLNNHKVIEILNEKHCYNMYLSGDYDYLLIDFYKKNKDEFYQYIIQNKFKYTKEDEYDFFTNIKGLTKVYINNKEKENAIKLFNELLNFAELLIK